MKNEPPRSDYASGLSDISDIIREQQAMGRLYLGIFTGALGGTMYVLLQVSLTWFSVFPVLLGFILYGVGIYFCLAYIENGYTQSTYMAALLTHMRSGEELWKYPATEKSKPYYLKLVQENQDAKHELLDKRAKWGHKSVPLHNTLRKLLLFGTMAVGLGVITISISRILFPGA